MLTFMNAILEKKVSLLLNFFLNEQSCIIGLSWNLPLAMSFGDIFIRLGKKGRGAARKMEMIPNTIKPSHQAPIQRGSL